MSFTYETSWLLQAIPLLRQLKRKNRKIVYKVILQRFRSAQDCCFCDNRLHLYC